MFKLTSQIVLLALVAASVTSAAPAGIAARSWDIRERDQVLADIDARNVDDYTALFGRSNNLETGNFVSNELVKRLGGIDDKPFRTKNLIPRSRDQQQPNVKILSDWDTAAAEYQEQTRAAQAATRIARQAAIDQRLRDKADAEAQKPAPPKPPQWYKQRADHERGEGASLYRNKETNASPFEERRTAQDKSEGERSKHRLRHATLKAQSHRDTKNGKWRRDIIEDVNARDFAQEKPFVRDAHDDEELFARYEYDDMD